MEVISSTENKLIKNIKKLKQKKYREEAKCYIVEGEHLVLEALKAGLVEYVLILEDAIFPIDIKKYYVTKELMQKITELSSAPNMIAVVKYNIEKDFGDKLLLIDALQDPGNLGTIIRSAVAFNVDTIVLGLNCVDLYNEKVLRATQGLIFHLNIIKRDLKTFIPEIKNNNYQVYGTKVTHGKDIASLKISKKYAFIMGNEGSGVSDELLDMCDDYVYIKTSDVCESLNVGVATGIILYELNKKGD